jgi:hypothetical protein
VDVVWIWVFECGLEVVVGGVWVLEVCRVTYATETRGTHLVIIDIVQNIKLKKPQ